MMMGGDDEPSMMNEGGEEGEAAPAQEEEADEDEKWGCCRWFKFILVRFVIVLIIFFVSICIPNLNILLTFTGAILGTLTNTWLPVLFYNRAYNNSY